jgi:predicted GIY-YIG superfamily endonuclease
MRTSRLRHGETIYYTGFTDNPHRRLEEHRSGIKSNFMSIFRISPKRIVYLEQIKGYFNALKREKEIKRMSFDKKFELIRGYGLI